MRRKVTLVCAALNGAYMLLDGVYASATGHYIGGTVGPWAALVQRIGIDPRSYTMHGIFIVYGIAWLAAIAFYATRRRSSVVAMAILTLWYIPFGTALSLVLLVTTFRGRERQLTQTGGHPRPKRS